jgi:hypothetical protein
VHGTISNDKISNLPLIVERKELVVNMTGTGSLKVKDGFAWIRLRHINCSSTCISVSIGHGVHCDRNKAISSSSSSIHYLPPRQTELLSLSEPFSSSTFGSCSLISHDRYVFFASFVLVADALNVCT